MKMTTMSMTDDDLAVAREALATQLRELGVLDLLERSKGFKLMALRPAEVERWTQFAGSCQKALQAGLGLSRDTLTDPTQHTRVCSLLEGENLRQQATQQALLRMAERRTAAATREAKRRKGMLNYPAASDRNAARRALRAALKGTPKPDMRSAVYTFPPTNAVSARAPQVLTDAERRSKLERWEAEAGATATVLGAWGSDPDRQMLVERIRDAVATVRPRRLKVTTNDAYASRCARALAEAEGLPGEMLRDVILRLHRVLGEKAAEEVEKYRPGQTVQVRTENGLVAMTVRRLSGGRLVLGTTPTDADLKVTPWDVQRPATVPATRRMLSPADTDELRRLSAKAERGTPLRGKALARYKALIAKTERASIRRRLQQMGAAPAAIRRAVRAAG